MGLSSCQFIKAKIKFGIKTVVDPVFPFFDAYTPDSKFNKKRFKDFLKVEVTPDVKSIYCFGDELGIDASYQFSFTCDTLTLKKIIQTNHLEKELNPENYGVNIGNDFSWWDYSKLNRLTRFRWNEGDFYRYLWYDTASQQAWFLDFDV
jgi:hypothetical protein